jgi:hypothetical protein
MCVCVSHLKRFEIIHNLVKNPSSRPIGNRADLETFAQVREKCIFIPMVETADPYLIPNMSRVFCDSHRIKYPGGAFAPTFFQMSLSYMTMEANSYKVFLVS